MVSLGHLFFKSMGKFCEHKIELLSPAGDVDCFYSALNNGADAVYLAGNRFGARAYANNFTEEQLIAAINYAHLFDKKVYLTVNTLLKDYEINELNDFILPLYCSGLDGVIVQDIGVISHLKKYFPQMEIHASTQMSISDIDGANLLKSLGVCRIVTARELSLSEVKNIIDNTGIEVETFIHGAMCYSYSGKCLFSSFIGGRSGNRGRCAQPCRLSYDDVYPLSMKDMVTLTYLPQLIEAGISSLKIEGRMKSKEYVSCVTGIYRKYIDLYYAAPESYKVDENDLKLLLDAYTRSGNCNGYYNMYNGKEMVTVDVPGYNGIKELDEKIAKYVKAEQLKLEINSYGSFNIGKTAFLKLVYRNISICEYGDMVEMAENKPTNKETIERQILKTGDSDFRISEISIDVDNSIFVPISKINELRRRALTSLEKEILSKYVREKITPSFENTDFSLSTTNDDLYSNNTLYYAEALNIETLSLINKRKYIGAIIIPSFLIFSLNLRTGIFKEARIVDETRKIISEIVRSGKKVYIKLPYVLRKVTDEYCQYINSFINEYNIAGFFVCNYEELNLLKRLGYTGDIISDIHLYCINNEARDTLLRNGITNSVVPIELNKKELINRHILGEFLYAYGKSPLMVSSQCINKTNYKCVNNSSIRYIKDRKNNRLPVYCNCDECLNIQYNCVPLFIKRNDDIINILSPKAMILSFTDENSNEVESILDYYEFGGDIPVDKYTKGHLNRGVE